MKTNIEKLISLADAHARADEYISGTYARENGNFRGCSIGCTIRDAKIIGVLPSSTDYGDHKAVADLLFGGCEQLAYLQDAIFEGLPEKDRSEWTPKLLRAVAKAPKNTDWKRIWHRWTAWLMTDLLEISDLPEDVQQAIWSVHDLHQSSSEGLIVTDDDWSEAAWAAEAARAAEAAGAAEAAEAAGAARAAGAAGAAEAAEAAGAACFQRMAKRLLMEIKR